MNAATHLTRARLLGTLGALSAVLLLASVGALMMGAVSIDLQQAWSDPSSHTHAILFDHRLPRVLHGLCVGAILGASGAALQGLLRNPLAEPFILGVSGGAALGAAVIGLTGLAAVVSETLGGFIGALTALLAVTALASRHGRVSPLAMLLVGVVFNGFAGALMMLLEAMADANAVHRVLLRLMGTLTTDPGDTLVLPLLGISAAAGVGAAMLMARRLNILSLGDDTARSLGISPDRTRLVLFVILSLPIGIAVATSGLIGFVGLIVPHAVRLVSGPDNRLLVPASALGGAILLVLADGAIRVLTVPLGTELPVGALTTAVGGPIFLWLLRRGRGLGEAT